MTQYIDKAAVVAEIGQLQDATMREIDFFPEICADECSVTMSINYNEEEARPLAPIHTIKVKAESFIDVCYEFILKLHEQKLL